MAKHDGAATWNGTVIIKVYDQTGNPRAYVKVTLHVCEIYVALRTGSKGTVTFHLYGVTLHRDANVDIIKGPL